MIGADHPLEDECWNPERSRGYVVDTIVAQDIDLVEDLQARHQPSKNLEDLLLESCVSS